MLVAILSPRRAKKRESSSKQLEPPASFSLSCFPHRSQTEQNNSKTNSIYSPRWEVAKIHWLPQHIYPVNHLDLHLLPTQCSTKAQPKPTLLAMETRPTMQNLLIDASRTRRDSLKIERERFWFKLRIFLKKLKSVERNPYLSPSEHQSISPEIDLEMAWRSELSMRGLDLRQSLRPQVEIRP